MSSRDANIEYSTAVRDPADNVIVEIGPDRKKYVLHGAFLKYHSEYFRKALKGQWKEAQDKVITLDDVEPGVCEFIPRH